MKQVRRKLFISYSRKDKALAQKVADALGLGGYDVFWDVAIPPGQKFDDYIFAQLQQSDAVVVLWSANSVASDYVKEEAEYAKTNSVLVPLRIDQTGLPFGFARIHTTDLLHWHGSIQDPEWRRVVDAIESSLADRASDRSDASLPPDDPMDVSRHSIPAQVVEPQRTGLSAPAIVAGVALSIVILGLFVFVFRSL